MATKVWDLFSAAEMAVFEEEWLAYCRRQQLRGVTVLVDELVAFMGPRALAAQLKGQMTAVGLTELADRIDLDEFDMHPDFELLMSQGRRAQVACTVLTTPDFRVVRDPGPDPVQIPYGIDEAGKVVSWTASHQPHARGRERDCDQEAVSAPAREGLEEIERLVQAARVEISQSIASDEERS